MSASPMMQQYLDAKGACGDALLLFRMGDFYEIFFDDAKKAARLVGLTLTTRDKGENPVPMAGFPYHQLESYLAKLIAAGCRVAVCDQVENPKQAKGLVKRELTRVVTPGTLTDDALLDPREANYLAACVRMNVERATRPVREGEAATRTGLEARSTSPHSLVGLAWVELSTGDFLAAVVPEARLADELARIGPAELLLPEGVDDALLPEHVRRGIVVTTRPGWSFGETAAGQALAKQFGTLNLEGFGFHEEDSPAVRAAGAILDYLHETQRASIDHIDRLRRYDAATTLQIDEASRRSLEITRTLRGGDREGSLLAAIDRTVSPLGSRLLAAWLANPLTDAAAIDERLDAVAELVSEPALVDALQDHLKGVYDLERLLARVATNRTSPRDLAHVCRTLRGLPSLKERLAGRASPLLAKLAAAIDPCPELTILLGSALEEDCPLSSRDGGFIRTGHHEPLDQLRDLATGGKEWIARYQATQAAETGIANLKVGFNKVFGYYLEITNTRGDKVPAHYIRKQTVKNAERYVTPELKEYEEKVLTADEKGKEVEYDLFCQLREAVHAEQARLRASAAVLAQLDVLCSLTSLARSRNYCRPQIVAEPVLDVIEGRHPVLDLLMTDGSFVPNDVQMDDSGRCLLITGPNMAGKSTYIRQVALLTLLAQIGSFVPAKRATIGVADRIFARVGASDELSRGQSTFMVEMTETARILNTATPRSLVILDEIGRGTSTYDGVSLAWAVVEYIQQHLACRTLFATHYHELTDLESSLPGVRNLNVAVREWEEKVIFLHKIVPGAADKSYGIHVARLAGIPREVNERAKQIMAQLESEHLDSEGRPKIAAGGKRKKIRGRDDLQLTLFAGEEHPLLDEIRRIDLAETTPMGALKLLEEWQTRAQRRTPP